LITALNSRLPPPQNEAQAPSASRWGATWKTATATSSSPKGTVGIIGYARARLFEPEAQVPDDIAPPGYYLMGVFVVPNERRTGIGAALTQARLDWIANRAPTAWFFVNARNAASIALHERLGFEEVTRRFSFPVSRLTGERASCSASFSIGRATPHSQGLKLVRPSTCGAPDLHQSWRLRHRLRSIVASTDEQPGHDLVDFSDDFLAFWAEAAGRRVDEQCLLWRQLYEQPHQEFFDLYYRDFAQREQLYDALRRYAGVADTLRARRERMRELFERYASAALGAFAAEEIRMKVVSFVGLFASNAWVASYGAEPTCFFALERFPETGCDELLMTHELAHQIHERAQRRDLGSGERRTPPLLRRARDHRFGEASPR
jgi:RimJ/RimL family protein N-acetyltransferase